VKSPTRFSGSRTMHRKLKKVRSTLLRGMLIKAWVNAKRGTTVGNRRAGYSEWTRAGRKQLVVGTSQFDRVIGTITRVIEAV
jgi:PadR family transcriptional regulator, regulatory protein PadR